VKFSVMLSFNSTADTFDDAKAMLSEIDTKIMYICGPQIAIYSSYFVSHIVAWVKYVTAT
jgi:hypothetical protein